MSVAFYLNIVMGGLLTGLVYGLAALGLALIFNVVRVVNLAHGGMMAAGIYGAAALTAARGTDPLLALPAVAAFYVGCTLSSAVAWYRGKGGMWKGRAQAHTTDKQAKG